MPSKSLAQAKVMAALSHGWRPEGGPVSKIPLKVAKEFHAADAGHKYGKGHDRGRAMGGVVPGMAGVPAMASQAFNPAVGAMGVMPGMPQPPSNMGSPMAGARPLKRGGKAAEPAHPDGKLTTGPLVSAVPGRTDHHYTHVPSGSYVIPADIVSKFGEGNTLAGMAALHKLFRMSGPGAKVEDRHAGKPVRVMLAGGEIVIPPHNVLETMQRLNNKKLTLDEAHRALDRWVTEQRKKLIKTLKSLPGPARD